MQGRKKKEEKGLTNRFLENEASPAHELFPELLSTPIGDIFSGYNESLARGHIITDFVHFAVNSPPLGLLVGLVYSECSRS